MWVLLLTCLSCSDPDGKPSEGAWAARHTSGPTGGRACANNDGSVAKDGPQKDGSGYNETFSHNVCR